MANLKAYIWGQFGTWVAENFHYAQAIRVDKTILCSGQGGWDPTKPVDLSGNAEFIPTSIEAEVDAAFRNCDTNLRNAGGKGFSQVYKIVTYSTQIPEQHEFIVKNLKKWMPDHRPIWTELGVAHLGHPDMRIEIDVEAYDAEGAKAAGAV